MTWLAISLDPAVLLQQGGVAVALAISMLGNWHLWRAYERSVESRIAEVVRVAVALERSSEALERSADAIAARRRP